MNLRDENTGFRLYPPFEPDEENKKYPSPFKNFNLSTKSFKILQQVENNLSLYPILLKIPFDLKLYSKDEDKCYQCYEKAIEMLYTKNEKLKPYSQEIWEFILKIVTLYDIEDETNTVPDGNVQEWYFEGLFQTVNRAKKNLFVTDLIFSNIKKYQPNDIPNGLIEMFENFIPIEKVDEILDYFSTILEHAEELTPVCASSIVCLFHHKGGKKYKEIVRSAYAKNAVDLADVSFDDYLYSINEEVDENDPLIIYMKKCSDIYFERRRKNFEMVKLFSKISSMMNIQ